MQSTRPPGQPPLDAKKSSYKRIRKFVKAQHKAKLISVREVKNIITILSVDRHSSENEEFELRDIAVGAHFQQRGHWSERQHRRYIASLSG
jgi:hypothetical protein